MLGRFFHLRLFVAVFESRSLEDVAEMSTKISMFLPTLSGERADDSDREYFKNRDT